MIIINRCQYCEEFKPTTNIQNKIPLLFFNDDFHSRYIICDDCKKELLANRSLTSKDGKCTAIIG